jgi:hypothetical protein
VKGVEEYREVTVGTTYVGGTQAVTKSLTLTINGKNVGFIKEVTN